MPTGQFAAADQSRIPLPAAANRLRLTRHGLLKILQRTNAAIRADGRWYVAPAIVDEIEAARRVLGLDRGTRRPGAAA
jgi:hypothetical protein